MAGDWCRVEADGTLLLMGRGNNCINSGGEKIYPEEVEEALKLHPDILDAAVIGVSVDSPFVLKNWSEQTKTNITLLSDYNREWIDHFGVEFNDLGGLSGYRVANRVVIIIEADGTVSYRWDAENPGVEPDYDELKAKLTS